MNSNKCELLKIDLAIIASCLESLGSGRDNTQKHSNKRRKNQYFTLIEMYTFDIYI